MALVVKAVKPILFYLLESEEVKHLVIDLLERYAKSTTNDVDDLIVNTVKLALLKK